MGVFTPALSGGLSLESEWLQCWRLDGLDFLLISNPSRLLSKPLGTVPSVPTTTGIGGILMFHNYFSAQARSNCLSIFLSIFIFNRWSTGTAKFTRQVLFFLFSFFVLFKFVPGLVFWLGLSDPFLSQNPWELSAFHFPERLLICPLLFYSFFCFFCFFVFFVLFVFSLCAQVFIINSSFICSKYHFYFLAVNFNVIDKHFNLYLVLCRYIHTI